MNRGLYDLAGISETARAAAWAKRLDCPMTKVSNTYLLFSRALDSHSASFGAVLDAIWGMSWPGVTTSGRGASDSGEPAGADVGRDPVREAGSCPAPGTCSGEGTVPTWPRSASSSLMGGRPGPCSELACRV